MDQHREASAFTPSRIAISGASGFVGSALSAALRAEGAEVLPLVRRPGVPGEIGWDPLTARIDRAALEGVDAVVHLAGESIAGVWTDRKKERIATSRLAGTRTLAHALTQLEKPPRVLLSASALGYYGNRAEEVLDEQSAAGTDFLATLTAQWEQESVVAAQAGIRVVHLRFGLVLDPGGGALKTMLLPFRLGLGARLGAGSQWMSWISRRDAVRAVRFLMTREISGPVNVVAPDPVRNREFTRMLSAALGRPAPWVIPEPILRHLTLGMAEALLLTSQRVQPRLLLEHAFDFVDPELESFLARALRDSPEP